MRENPAHVPKRFRLLRRQQRACENAHSSAFLACRFFALGNAARTFASSLSLKESTCTWENLWFFFKNSARHRASVDGEKHRLCRHMIFRNNDSSYGKSYDNACDFSPSTDAQCRAPIFKKNCVYFAHRVTLISLPMAILILPHTFDILSVDIQVHAHA